MLINRIFLMIALLNSVAAVHAAAPPTVVVAAASDFQFALDSILVNFKKANQGIQVKTVYGSSGKLTEQISNDAPFDLFFSADISYPKKLRETGFAISEPSVYGVGSIVIWSNQLDPSQDKMNSLVHPSIHKISIADPSHAPYGQRADECMRFYKIYDQVKDKLVFGENISQAAQYITSGAADIGIIALSLALSPAMQQTGGKYYVIPQESYSKLEQAFVLLKHSQGNMAATALAGYIASPASAAIIRHFGFREK